MPNPRTRKTRGTNAEPCAESEKAVSKLESHYEITSNGGFCFFKEMK